MNKPSDIWDKPSETVADALKEERMNKQEQAQAALSALDEVWGDIQWIVSSERECKSHIDTIRAALEAMAEDGRDNIHEIASPKDDIESWNGYGETSCETCKGNDEICAELPSLRHCEKAQRGENGE